MKDNKCTNADTMLQRIQKTVAESLVPKTAGNTTDAQIEDWQDKKGQTQGTVAHNDTAGPTGHINGRISSKSGDSKLVDEKSGEKQFDIKSSQVKTQKLLLP